MKKSGFPLMILLINVLMTTEQKAHATFAPKTPGGNPADIDTTNNFPTVEVLEGDGTAEVDADGKGVTFITGSAVAKTKYLVKADADLGEGIVTLEETVEVDQVAPSASNLGFVIETPVLK